jgi:hypothetical protein
MREREHNGQLERDGVQQDTLADLQKDAPKYTYTPTQKQQNGRIINNTKTHIQTHIHHQQHTNQNSLLQVCYFLLVRDRLLRCLEVILDNVLQTDPGFLNLPSQEHACRRNEQAVMSLKRMARKKSLQERLGDAACALRATRFIKRNGSA